MPERYRIESGEVLGKVRAVANRLPMNATLSLDDSSQSGALEAAVESAASTAQSRTRRFPRKAALLTIAALAIGAGGYRWWDHARTWETTDNAVITGTAHQVAARIAGTVEEVMVLDNQQVQ
jgi:membrane fusion protein (multidrug efflux system)